MRPGVGVVTDELADKYRAMEFAVNWTPPPKPDPNSTTKPPVEPTYTWQSFASRMPGKQAAERMLTKDYFDAAPFKEVQGIESFIELGNEFDSFPDSDDYENVLSESRIKPPGNTLFDLDKLEDKQRQARRFRQSILGTAILDRFQNEMQFWEDDTAINQLKILAKNINRPEQSGTVLGDSNLQVQEKLPAVVDQYNKEFQDYLRLHTDLIDIVDRRLRRSSQNTNDRLSLTPTQVELLGRASQRYLPLIAAFKPKPSADAPTTPGKQNDELDSSTIVFDLEVESSTSKSGLRDGLSIAELHESTTNRIASQNATQVSDTGYRFLLAAGGSEAATPRAGVAPKILWTQVEPDISFESSVTQFRVNPFDMDPLSLAISAQAVELVDLSLSMDGGEIPTGLEFGLSSKFERKRPIPFEDGDLSERRTKDIKVYLRHRRPDSLFGKPIAMKITAVAADESLEPKEFRLTVILTRDPTVQLLARREIGVGEAPETRASLTRWGGKLPDNWIPLTINSLANVRSAFEFSLVNNSSRPKTLRSELYNLVDLPPDFGNSQMFADRPKSDQVQELASWLYKQQDLPGAISLKQSNQSLLTLVAETQPIEVPAGGTPVLAEFSVPLVGDKQDPTEASLQAQDVRQGMLVVFYEDASTRPAWFQWLAFEPKEPADATVEKRGAWLQPLPDILDVFQQNPDPLSQRQRNDTERMLSTSWIPAGTKDKPGPAAALTTVSEVAFQENRHFVNPLNLKNIFQGQSLIPESRERPALLLLNLLGIPNYGIFELRGDSINQASFRDRLTGIRVASMPSPDWECYPQTWSLIGSNKILKTANDSNMQDVYLRRPDKAVAGQIKLELLLPVLKGKVLGKGANDFELAWRNGNVSKLFPNQRKHFVRADRTGLDFWSTVRAHFLTDSSNSFTNGSVLEIRRTTGKRELLGGWRFTTRPPVGPSVDIRLSENATTVGQLPQITVEVDLSQVKPPLDLKEVSLSVDGTDLKNTTRFLQDPVRFNRPGVFRFPYDDLVEELGVDKVGTHEIQINAKTFFGVNEASVTRLEIKPNPKPVEVKSEPVLIHVGLIILNFEDAAGEPSGVFDFKSLKVDGTEVPWTEDVQPDGTTVPWAKDRQPVAGEIVASGRATLKKVRIYEIKEGKHDIQVTALMDDETTTLIAKGTIEVKEDEEVKKDEASSAEGDDDRKTAQEFTLKFAKPQ